jgi:N-acetylneuraminate synthase
LIALFSRDTIEALINTNMAYVTIGKKKVGKAQPCFIIAEIGINHNGSLDIAKQLIDAAVKAGADAVKFQKRTVDVVYTKEELEKPRENPFGKTNGDLKRGLEFGKKEYKAIDEYCKEKGILWLASPWDEASVDFLEEFNVPAHKIASASLTDEGLLKHIKKTGKPVILSTGMSTMQQIDKAVRTLDPNNLILLHTVSTYPAEDDEIPLSVIHTLKRAYPSIPIGYSGHERGLSLSIAAVAIGSSVIERHITLDRKMWGSDQAASLEPHDFENLIRDIRSIDRGWGDGFKRVLPKEVPIMQKLRRK